MNLVLWKEKIDFRKNWVIFLESWGEAELILGIWGAKAKYFHGAVNFFRDFWDKCINFRVKGAKTPYGEGAR